MDRVEMVRQMRASLEAERALAARFQGTGCERLADYLAQTASLRGTGPEGWPYASCERLLLQRGKAFQTKPLPEGIERGMQRRCFDNSRALALMDPGRFAYCEGWAFPGSGIPVHHAWVLDIEDGMATEPTWRDGLSRGGKPMYVGLALDIDFVLDALNRSGSVLDDYMGDHPILRGAAAEAEWLHPAHSAELAPAVPRLPDR